MAKRPAPPPIAFRNAVAKQNHLKLSGPKKVKLSSLNLATNLSPTARMNGLLQQVYQGKP